MDERSTKTPRSLPTIGARRGCAPPRCLAELAAPPEFEVRGDMRAGVISGLFRARSLTWVPVVDETGRPIGTLSRGDLAAAGLENAPPADASDDRLIVEDVMSAELGVLPASASLAEASELLAGSGVPELVVVDCRGIMLGTVSRADLAGLEEDRAH